MMVQHSIKVPQLYKVAAKLAKDVAEGLGTVKQLVYQCKHRNLKAVYALAIETLKHKDELDIILKKSKLFDKEPRLEEWLSRILITELLWGKKRLGGEAKPVQTILAYEQIFKAHISDSPIMKDHCKQVVKPRYLRVNTVKIAVNEVIDVFRDEGWILSRTSGLSYRKFLEVICSLKAEEFTVDLHLPYLLIFPPKTQFYNHYLYKNGSIVLQDKASCLPAQILNPQAGSKVLDMCAAPGMKATQCASLMDNVGEVIAVEFDQKRLVTLNLMVKNLGANCVRTINRDVLTITEKDCPDVDYILVDPSCSGSGIVDRFEFEERSKDPARLEKLAGFQIKILRSALNKFTATKRVVYSTCSIYPEENEDVVRQVLETSHHFKLVDAKQFVGDNWLNFGSPDFGGIGERCLYAKPEDDLTNGFFVAVFERLGAGERNDFLNRELCRFEKKVAREGQNKAKLAGNRDFDANTPKKRNKRKKTFDVSPTGHVTESKPKKKKRNEADIVTGEEPPETKPKKKKISIEDFPESKSKKNNKKSPESPKKKTKKNRNL